MDKILSRPAKDLHKDHGYLCDLVEELCLQHGESVDPGESLAKLLQKISNLDTLTYISHKYIDKFVDPNGLLKSKIDIKGLDIPTLSILLLYVNEFPTSDRTENSLSCKRPSHVACCANCSHACILCTLNVCKGKCCVGSDCDHPCKFCGVANSECKNYFKVCCYICNECRACATSNDTSCDLRNLKDAISDIRDKLTKFDASTLLVSKTQEKGKEDQSDKKTEKCKSWDKVVEKFVEKIEEIADEIKEDRETRATSSSSGKKKPSKQSNAPKSSDDAFEEMKDAVKDELENQFKDMNEMEHSKGAKESYKQFEYANTRSFVDNVTEEKIDYSFKSFSMQQEIADCFLRPYKQELESVINVKEGDTTYQAGVTELNVSKAFNSIYGSGEAKITVYDPKVHMDIKQKSNILRNITRNCLEKVLKEKLVEKEARATPSSSEKKKPLEQSTAPKSSDDAFEEMKDAVKDELEKQFKDMNKMEYSKGANK